MTVFTDLQARGEYFGGYRVCLGEGGQAPHVGEVDIDEERWGSAPRS